MEQSVGFGSIGPHGAELLVVCSDLLEELVHALRQDYPSPKGYHLDLCGLVDLELGGLFGGAEDVLDLVEKSRHDFNYRITAILTEGIVIRERGISNNPKLLGIGVDYSHF